MAVSLQVLYPTANGTTFDHDYYMSTHSELVGKHWGSFIESGMITKGVSGGPGTPAGYHVIGTVTFADQAALDAALAAIGPIIQDVPNFYSGEPQMLIGEVLG